MGMYTVSQIVNIITQLCGHHNNILLSYNQFKDGRCTRNMAKSQSTQVASIATRKAVTLQVCGSVWSTCKARAWQQVLVLCNAFCQKHAPDRWQPGCQSI
jgi:hypothetical protein